LKVVVAGAVVVDVPVPHEEINRTMEANIQKVKMELFFFNCSPFWLLPGILC
jgi:hypothetical protein